MQCEISVVHLVYVPFGTDLFQRFLDSYKKHPAGIKHQLVIMFNGFGEQAETGRFIDIIDREKLDYKIIYSAEKYDIGSYFFAAEKLDAKYFLFLNSYSIILADNWLNFYYSAMQNENVGAVGASGAGWRNEYRALMETDRSKFSFAVNLQARIYSWLHFGRAVYPHLRTNSFFIERQVFLSLKYHQDFTKEYFKFAEKTETKNKTLYFEHGNKSLTYQLGKRGLKVLLVDRHGGSYQPPDWMKSKTFWISDQENLLIHDNQTLKYQNGNEKIRKYLTYMAWGI